MPDWIEHVLYWVITHWFELAVLFLLLGISDKAGRILNANKHVAAHFSEDYHNELRQDAISKAARGK